MYKINCLCAFAALFLSNLNIVSGTNYDNDANLISAGVEGRSAANLKKNNDNADNQNAEDGDDTNSDTSDVVDYKHNLTLDLVKTKLDSISDQLTKKGVNLAEKYDLVNMIAGKHAFNINHRAGFNMCSIFGWEGASDAWVKRFSTYNYHLCKIDQGGGGDCFFHSLAGSLKMAGYTVGKLKKMNDYNTNFERYAPQNLSDDDFFTHVHLRKMAAAYFVTYNPELETDVAKFDTLTFIDRMSFYKLDDSNSRYAEEDQIKARLAQYMHLRPTYEIAMSVYELHSEVSGKHWGDAFDKYALENILNITILLFRTDDSCLLLGDYTVSKNTDAYVLIYYYDMYHYQSAGIVNIENPDKVHTAYSKEELPNVLSLITFLDTGIELKK